MTYKVQIDDEIRDATPEEAAHIDKLKKDDEARLAALEQIAAAKASAQNKLAALGLTEEEIGALLGR